MPDEVFIYLIVVLNVAVQLMLIRSLDFPEGGKRRYYAFAVIVPALIILSMRLLIALDMLHNRVADQSAIERHVTTAASILLLAGPWLVTAAAIFDKRRKGWMSGSRSRSKGPD
jgi:hypothetical protein